MSTHNRPHTESGSADRRFGQQEVFQLIERNQGRLHVLEYASFGLKHSGGSEAACLVWIIGDVLADMEILREAFQDACSE